MHAALLAALFAVAAPTPAPEPASPWKSAAPGLEIGVFDAPVRSAFGDSRITIARIDPEHYEFRLLSAKLLKLDQTLTAPEWAKRYNVTGVINASMYSTDHRSSVAFMKDATGANNARWTKDNAVFAAAPTDKALPPVQILDRACGKADDVQAGYAILIQNIRMLDCAGANTWAPQPRKWSAAAVGTDGAGRVLFIHCRSPYSMHDFVDMLRALPLDLKRLMYVEGGPEASLYVTVDGKDVVSQVGSFETGFREMDDNKEFWPLPNVIGFAPK